MTRGDHVYIMSGDWEGLRGRIAFIDHDSGTVTITADWGPTHMVKTSIRNVARVISRGDVV